MENPNITQFRKLLNTFNDKFKIYDETNTHIEYDDPTKIIKELKKYEENYDEKFKKYLEKNYTFDNKKEIMQFIKETPTMTGFLYEITPLLKAKFPKHKYSLEYIQDPEIENWEQLSLNILADFDKENIKQLIKDLLNFEIEKIDTKIKKYKLINKFMMDVEPICNLSNG